MHSRRAQGPTADSPGGSVPVTPNWASAWRGIMGKTQSRLGPLPAEPAASTYSKAGAALYKV